MTANSKNENEIRDRARITKKRIVGSLKKFWSYFIHFGSQKKSCSEEYINICEIFTTFDSANRSASWAILVLFSFAIAMHFCALPSFLCHIDSFHSLCPVIRVEMFFFALLLEFSIRSGVPPSSFFRCCFFFFIDSMPCDRISCYFLNDIVQGNMTKSIIQFNSLFRYGPFHRNLGYLAETTTTTIGQLKIAYIFDHK